MFLMCMCMQAIKFKMMLKLWVFFLVVVDVDTSRFLRIINQIKMHGQMLHVNINAHFWIKIVSRFKTKQDKNSFVPEAMKQMNNTAQMPQKKMIYLCIVSLPEFYLCTQGDYIFNGFVSLFFLF